jgi:signal transduction histidine kinase
VVLEASLRLAAIHGETAILSYTRDITERNRLHAELMKQDRLASVGMLAAGVAHELNNPLTALAMQVRQLREDAHEWPPHVDHVLRQMEEATNGMNTIISDLLFMARPVEKPQAHVDVAKIIQSTVALLRAGTPRCPPVKVDIDPLPALHGWASKLGQVFLNILRNAVQAVESVPNGTVQVRGRVVGDGIEVTVSDNGPGVTPQVLARLAQPFFTTKPQGTGLGLWISQTLVAQHGGKLDVASTEGGGTTVTVSLPQTLAGAPP